MLRAVVSKPSTIRQIGARSLSSTVDEPHRYQIPNYGPPEEMEEAKKWKYISAAGFIFVGGYFYKEMSSEHPHVHEKPAAYKKIRAKQYPWEASDCNLFDIECKKAFYEAKKAK
eukprot:c12148_g1_i1.p1 GENE.c12148_g1_i1~~c12148_g1_i1.p1  ORF type:complete len:127 (+),score=33.32 c12148_g1_i1:42-383(+)